MNQQPAPNYSHHANRHQDRSLTVCMFENVHQHYVPNCYYHDLMISVVVLPPANSNMRISYLHSLHRTTPMVCIWAVYYLLIVLMMVSAPFCHLAVNSLMLIRVEHLHTAKIIVSTVTSTIDTEFVHSPPVSLNQSVRILATYHCHCNNRFRSFLTHYKYKH